jgi:hypothetical protein
VRVREVLVPVTAMGAGTGTVSVQDARTGEVLRVPTDRVRVVNARVYVAAVSHGVEDGLHRVTLPGRVCAWVRAVDLGQAGAAA